MRSFTIHPRLAFDVSGRTKNHSVPGRRCSAEKDRQPPSWLTAAPIAHFSFEQGSAHLLPVSTVFLRIHTCIPIHACAADGDAKMSFAPFLVLLEQIREVRSLSLTPASNKAKINSESNSASVRPLAVLQLLCILRYGVGTSFSRCCGSEKEL